MSHVFVDDVLDDVDRRGEILARVVDHRRACDPFRDECKEGSRRLVGESDGVV